MIYDIKENFLQEPYLSRYRDNYPVDQIKEHCADSEMSEHAASLDGNYSAPVLEDDFRNYIKNDVLSQLKQQHLGFVPNHDHHYVNYHMDDPGSSLEIHNDLKNFRWLITSQIYLNHNNQGVRLLDDHLNLITQIPCEPNLLYSLCASPYTWHNVPVLTQRKHSILFRVGKRRHKTIAHPANTNEAFLIVNDNHSDKHYAKLGLRMGNLTEAMLHKQGCTNICHTDWRGDWITASERLKKKYKTVHVIPSGVFDTNDKFLITDSNYMEVADTIFNVAPTHTSIHEAEKVMKEYYHNQLHLVYKDLYI